VAVLPGGAAAAVAAAATAVVYEYESISIPRGAQLVKDFGVLVAGTVRAVVRCSRPGHSHCLAAGTETEV
jgi:hypothetical protein